MKSIKLLLLFMLVVTLAAVVFQNQAVWHVRFLWLSGDIPGIIVLLLTTAAGFVTGMTVTLLMKRRANPHRPRDRTDCRGNMRDGNEAGQKCG